MGLKSNQCHLHEFFGQRRVEDRLSWLIINVTLWFFNIAMENSPFIDVFDDLPIKHDDFL